MSRIAPLPADASLSAMQGNTKMAAELKMLGDIGGPPVDIVVGLRWRAITAVDTSKQTFDASVDVVFTARDGVATVCEDFDGPGVVCTNMIQVSAVPLLVRWRATFCRSASAE